MKHLFYLIICITCFAPLKAQKEFAPIGAEWYFSKREGMADVGYVKFTAVKDTIINAVSFKLIERVNYRSNGDSVVWANEYLHQRGDTVFYLRDNELKVLYNFALQQNDTLTFYSDQAHPCGDERSDGIIMVDTIFEKDYGDFQIEVQQCLPIESSAWEFETIVKGIGHFSGFYPRFVNTCGITDNPLLIGSLRCYQDDELGLYNFQNKACDTLIRNTTAVAENIEVNQTLNLFPTISKNDILFIEIVGGLNSKEPYEIINQAGKVVQKGFLTGTTNTINTSKINSGLYFFIISNQRNRIKSFIKQ